MTWTKSEHREPARAVLSLSSSYFDVAVVADAAAVSKVMTNPISSPSCLHNASHTLLL